MLRRACLANSSNNTWRSPEERRIRLPVIVLVIAEQDERVRDLALQCWTSGTSFVFLVETRCTLESGGGIRAFRQCSHRLCSFADVTCDCDRRPGEAGAPERDRSSVIKRVSSDIQSRLIH